MKNKILTFMIGIFVGVITTTLVFFVYTKNTKSLPNSEKPSMMRGEKGSRGDFPGKFEEEQIEKETTAESVEEGIIVIEKNIDLSQYSSNITIKEAGDYTLTGEFKNAVLINAEGEVRLNLDNVTIKNEKTATIVNQSENSLAINLLENTTNTLSDGGSSEYDGCIYSLGALTIEGSGELNIYGNQVEGEGIATETNNITINGGNIKIESEDDGLNAGGDGGLITINDGNISIKANGDGIDSNKSLIINGGYIYTVGSSTGGDAGIDTDDGFVINGGTVIALGSGMLEKPEASSKQKSVCLNLNNKILAGTTISLKNEKNEEMLSFEANEEFKTLIVSDEKIASGTYYLYQNGDKIDFSATVK